MTASGEWGFLREAAAVQRTNTTGECWLAEIRFTAGDALVVPSGSRPISVPLTADRRALHAALPARWAAPDPGELARLPVLAPPPLVYADLLDELGDLGALLHEHPPLIGRPDLSFDYAAITTDGRAATVDIVSSAGVHHRSGLSLKGETPLVGVPYNLVEQAVADTP